MRLRRGSISLVRGARPPTNRFLGHSGAPSPEQIATVRRRRKRKKPVDGSGSRSRQDRPTLRAVLHRAAPWQSSKRICLSGRAPGRKILFGFWKSRARNSGRADARRLLSKTAVCGVRRVVRQLLLSLFQGAVTIAHPRWAREIFVARVSLAAWGMVGELHFLPRCWRILPR